MSMGSNLFLYKMRENLIAMLLLKQYFDSKVMTTGNKIPIDLLSSSQ